MSVTPFRMSGNSQESLPDLWEWSGGPPGSPGVVVKPSLISGSGREDLPDVCESLSYIRKWSGDNPDVREWLGCYPGCP